MSTFKEHLEYHFHPKAVEYWIKRYTDLETTTKSYLKLYGMVGLNKMQLAECYGPSIEDRAYLLNNIFYKEQEFLRLIDLVVFI